MSNPMSSPIIKDLCVGDTTTIQFGYPSDGEWWPNAKCRVLAIIWTGHYARYIVRMLEDDENTYIRSIYNMVDTPVLLVSAIPNTNNAESVLQTIESIAVNPDDEDVSLEEVIAKFQYTKLKLED